MGRPSLWLALSCVLGTLGPIVCSIIQYHPKKILSAWKQQLKSFSFTRCDVDIVIAAVAVQIIVTILCFGVGRRILSKAHTWRFARPKTSPAGVGSINQGVATQSQSLDKEAQEEDDELLRRMNYLMSSFPAHVAFRYVYAVTAAVSLLGLCYSLTRLLVAFNHTSSGGRWSLLLFPFCLQCLQWPLWGDYIRSLDTTARKNRRETRATEESSATDMSEHLVPLLDVNEVEGETKKLTPKEARAAKRHTRKLDGLRKKVKEEKLRKMDSTKAKANVARLLSLSKSDVGLLSLGFASLVLAATAGALIPHFTGAVIDKINGTGHRSEFSLYIIFLLLSGLAQGVFGGLRGGILSAAISRMKVRMRQLLFASITQQEMGFFDETLTGEVTSRLVADTTQIGDLIGLNVNMFLRSLVQCISILVFMFATSWKLTILTGILIPMLVLVSQIYGKFIRAVSEDTQSAVADSTKVAEEVISSMATVRSFANEPNERKRYQDSLDDFYDLNMVYNWAYGFYVIIVTALPVCVTGAVLFFGGNEVLQGQLSAGDLVSFLLYQFSLTDNISTITSVFSGFAQALGAAEKVFTWIDRKPAVTEEGTLVPTRCEGKIEFRNVIFSYPSRTETVVLNGVSFTVNPGETVAIVGPSGGGKSSCVKLIERFYTPTGGDILLDGLSLGEYDRRWRHRVISMVGQEPVLFARTIGENIQYGFDEGEDVPPAEIERAARLANAHEFIVKLPKGYDTQIGEKGVTLSGGQKQRIAIARALLRNPTVLLLDEATSALDAESEALVQDAIDRLMVGRTVIVIAHRLSTVQNANRILVIQSGAIQESGTHSELLAAGGTYFQLVQRQLQKGAVGAATGIEGKDAQ